MRYKGWYKHAKISWLHLRVWRWVYYANKNVTSLTPWVEYKDGSLYFSRGLFPDAEEEQRTTIVRDMGIRGFWKARKYEKEGHGKLDWHPKIEE